MRLIRGHELSRIIRKVHAEDSEWNMTRALGVLLKVCEAMSYAHEKEVVHRDLKPANVMVGRHGEVYVMDWGLAHVEGSEDSHDIRPSSEEGVPLTRVQTDRRDLLESGADEPMLTRDGSIIGTPYYMPPEQAAGRVDEVGMRSDVYAVGAMMYHLLTGCVPYHAPGASKSPHAVLARVLSGPPQPIGELAPRVPVELIAICERAMARKADDRYPDMGDLGEDLRAFLENRVVRAHRTGAVVEFKKWVERNRRLAGTVLAALLLFLGGTATAALREARLRSQADEARAASESVTDFLVGQLRALEPAATRGRPVQVSDLLDQAATSLEGELGANSKEAARLRAVVGDAFFALGLYEKAEPLMVRTWQDRCDLLGEDDPDALSALNGMASLYQKQGRYQEAEDLYLQALEKRSRVLGEEHPSTLVTLNDLGLLYLYQGRHADAEPLLSLVLERYRATLGEDHRETLVALHNLAGLYHEQGRVEETEPIVTDLLERCREVLGESHPLTLSALNSLASFYDGQGRLGEAEPLYVLGLEKSRAVLGESHPETLIALNDLAALYSKQGRFEDAEPLHLSVLEKSRKVLGAEHRDTALALASLAEFYTIQGRYREAEPVSIEAFEVCRTAVGAQHQDTQILLGNLRRLYDLWLRRPRGSEGANDPGTIAVVRNLAALECSLGRYAFAEPMYVECLDKRLALLGAEDPETLVSFQDLAELYALQGRWEEAEQLARELLDLTPETADLHAQRRQLLERILQRLDAP